MKPCLALDEATVRRRLGECLPHWTLADGQLYRAYRTEGWKGALMVVNAIGHLAEAAWHHPDIALGWGRVEVRLSTHDAKGITDRDFALAQRIEDLVQWQPSREDGPLSGTPDDPRYRYVLPD
ncbi:MAG: 4a-hydroxytetrahydrobiopterin dehydratase [Rhodocyclaceae bacterium]|jgi:4a-hydroxytetrahydrobiopterin dehydratase|nr:4a-hydroxytetrahydrobiopterin dehydratase [Rhodocyclaceae bacterium]